METLESKTEKMNTRNLDYSKVKENIREHLTEYILKYNIKSLVLGISGGIDSALCVALAKPVCDKLNVKLIGRSITISTNKEDEKDRARKVGNYFCSDFKEIDLSDSFAQLYPQISEGDNDKINIGNAKARLRMMYLYDLARTHNGLVLSTDNYTELLLGFWTLHGDVGDLGMIQSLWKHEVYNLSLEVNKEFDNKEPLQLCIDATPTDGLGISNSDVEQLGAKNYDEVDTILIKCLGADLGETGSIEIASTMEELNELKNHSVFKKYESTHFKRNNPYNFPINIILKQ